MDSRNKRHFPLAESHPQNVRYKDLLSTTFTYTPEPSQNTPIPGPSPRYATAMAQLGDKLVLYSGNGGSDDTWEWDGKTWTRHSVTGPNSGGRRGHTMATLGNKIVLFGGVGTEVHDTWENNTWTWDGNAWTQVAVTGPPTRQYAGMAAR